MAKRPCLDCKRPTERSRCPGCERARDTARGNSAARGYGASHQALRSEWVGLVATGNVKCWRCGDYIGPSEPFDLGHDDADRGKYRGPEHVRCNRSTSAH